MGFVSLFIFGERECIDEGAKRPRRRLLKVEGIVLVLQIFLAILNCHDLSESLHEI